MSAKPPTSRRIAVILHRRDLIALDQLAERDELNRSAWCREQLKRIIRAETASPKTEAAA